MNDHRSRQASFNSHSSDQWDAFAEHRLNVSALLGAQGPPGRTRICVIGAGNANDLDLPALLNAHREVHLVDLDAEALKRGAVRQGVEGHAGLCLHGGYDVTGMLDTIATWTPSTFVRPGDLSALAGWPAGRVAPLLPGGFDRVASTCLISQLKETSRHSLGPGHRQLGEVERAIRAGHLRLLARLASHGGRASLVTEVVSTDTLPELANLTDDDLPGLLPRLARDSNHFRGVHPAELVAALRADSTLEPDVTGWEVARPWRWRLHARLYLVSGITFRVGGRPR